MAAAKRWLASAKASAGLGNYDNALFSLGMSVEVALKAVMYSLGVDVPKTHSIGDLLEAAVGQSRVPKKFKADLGATIATFNELLALRSASGYSFETRATLEGLHRKYDSLVERAEVVVKLCEDATG